VESRNWKYDFQTQKGKMFGVLGVQLKEGSYGFIATISGKLSRNGSYPKFIPSIFDDSSDDFFINKGMTELTEIGNQIKNTNDTSEIVELKEKRKLKSIAIQQQLFENYQFLNQLGEKKNVLQVFERSSHGNPPSAAGECAAPKLLQFAFGHGLSPIAIAEFWWGNSPKNKGLALPSRKHKGYYPACKDKCRPILEYMLNDTQLFNQVNGETN
jgi:tRNA pseudouridine32 synthase/23S rRNA pseudouridine746 synthase